MQDAKSIVFVVGAGASFEVGFPTGEQLRALIVQELSGSSVGFRPDCSYQSLVHVAAGARPLGEAEILKIESYKKAAGAICRGLPSALSIDTFVHMHRGDADIADCAKFAIAKCILSSEKSNLMNMISKLEDGVSSRNIKNTWFMRMFNLLFTAKSWDELPEVLSRIAFVTFNYDRTIEFFLFNTFKFLFGTKRGDEEIAGLVNQLAIYHPYGVVGRLPWMLGEGVAIEFGQDQIYPRDLVFASKCLRTFTESEDQAESKILEIRRVVRDAEKTVFLGFGYIDMNVDLLYEEGTPEKEKHKQSCRIIGTAWKESDSNKDVIERSLSAKSAFATPIVTLRNDLRASEILDEYSRELRLT